MAVWISDYDGHLLIAFMSQFICKPHTPLSIPLSHMLQMMHVLCMKASGQHRWNESMFRLVGISVRQSGLKRTLQFTLVLSAKKERERHKCVTLIRHLSLTYIQSAFIAWVTQNCRMNTKVPVSYTHLTLPTKA